jgi:hypothetical protein
MRTKLGLFPCLLLIVVASTSGQTVTSPDRQAAKASALTEQAQIEGLLSNYQTAYSKGDYNGILKLWPDLESDRKAASKLKIRLTRKDIEDTKLSLSIESSENTSSGSVVHCKQLETYTLVHSDYTATTDAILSRMPAENPGPNQHTVSTHEKKQSDVWITVQKTDNGYVIRSITTKKPH